MKKIILTFISLLLTITFTASFAKPIKTIKSSQIQTKTYRKKLTDPKRRIDLKYSTLSGQNKSIQRFNTIVNTTMKRNIQYFLKNSQNAIMSFTSVLKIKNRVYFFKPNNLISIQYQRFLYFAGEAHPNTTYFTLNYDLASGKSLQLKNILVRPKRDLAYVASYCMRQLSRKRVGHVNFINEGAGPEFKNYQSWNFTTRGLLVTFNADQVAAYVFGTQHVLIPYPLLKGRIKPRYYRFITAR